MEEPLNDTERGAPMWAGFRSRPTGIVLAWFVVTLLVVVNDWRAHPFDPSQAPEFQNPDGALDTALVVMVAELAVLLVVVRPWTYRASAGRALLALAVFGPWTLWLFPQGMHAGGMFMLHLLGLIVLCVGLFVALLRAAAAGRGSSNA